LIIIIDYGLGNLASIKNMFKKIGAESMISSDPEDIFKASKLILPGVGHFAKGIENLSKSGLIPILSKAVLEDKKPVLGICLGMQLMTSHSEEGDTKGLGWIEAETKRFKFEDRNIKIPHMGWSENKYVQNIPLTKGIENEQRYYFVHSYHVECLHPENVLGTCNYGIDFHSAIIRDNIAGVQFHPEKSHKFGMTLLKNFVNQ
jgi:glutamine amidotransferase